MVKPSEVAKLIGLDEKWLAAAREGRKGSTGPPFVKIGSGRTSPIRYPLSELIKWMESFPVYSSHNCRHTSYSSFLNFNNSEDLWPFSLYDDGTLDEIFNSMNSDRFAREFTTRQIIWLVYSSLPTNLRIIPANLNSHLTSDA